MVELEECRKFWQIFDLKSRRETLETQCLEVGTLADAADESRKALGEKVVSFKRETSDETKLQVFPSLLKAMQDEIDMLTRQRIKLAKNFLKLASDLSGEASTDPALVLSSAVNALQLSEKSKIANEKAKETALRDVSRLSTEVFELRQAAKISEANAREDISGEINRLKRENAALESELGSLRNQDITIRELESRLVTVEGEIEAQVATRLAQRESELRRAFEAELEEVREAETAAEGRVLALHSQLAESVANRDETHAAMYAMRARCDEELGEKQIEADFQRSESLRAKDLLAQTTAQLDDARKRLAALNNTESNANGADSNSSSSTNTFSSSSFSSSPSLTSSGVHISDPYALAASLRAQVDMHRSRAEAAEEECARSAISLQQLQEESSRWSEMLEARKRLYEDTVNELQSRLQQRDAAIQATRKELNERPLHSDIAVLRKQLSILQSLHFNSNNDDQEVEGGGSGDVQDTSNGTHKESSSSSSVEAGGSSGGTGELLDVTTIMLARVRKLESKVVRAEAAKVDAESLCTNLRDELEAARVEIEEQRELILRLEDGLASSTKSVSNGLKLVSKEPLKSSDEIEDVTMSAHKSQLDAVLSFSSPSKFPTSSSQSPRGDTVLSLGFASPYHSADSSSEHVPHAAVSVAEVLRAQRDRLNTRVLELEADAQARIAEVSTCHTRINKLTNDNVKLYEKVRYLQSIVRSMTGDVRIEVGEKGSTASSRAGITQRSSASSSSSALVSEEDFEIRYKDLYNASLDPFERFAAQQRQQKFLSLSRADRFALSSGKLILGSKVARTFAVGYAIMLHLLVAVTLWHFSTARHFEGEAGCSIKTAAGGAPLGLEIRS